jgi:hypothetical protein
MTERFIEFDVQWSAAEQADAHAEDAWGKARLVIGGDPVWCAGEPGDAAAPGFDWSWADLLDHLADSWPWLMWEQAYPVGLSPVDPSTLRDVAEQRWLGMPQERVYAEDTEVCAWEHRHYLNAGLGGLYAPGVCVLREGRQAVVTALGRTHRVPFADVRRDLETIGETIAARLRAASSERAAEFVARWERREGLPPARRRQIETGLAAELVESLPLAVAPDDGDDPLRAVARMTRGADLDAEQLVALIRSVNGAPRGRLTSAFHELSAAARQHMTEVEETATRWFDQGYRLAVWLRAEIGLAGRADPAGLLRKWGINVHEVALPGRFDAVAIWSRRDAALLVNTRGVHARQQRGRRATLAHEIAHLLIDREGALPVADVVGGLAPRHAEARANAFAAEFLAPRGEIEATLAAENLREANAALRRLCSRYNASQQLVAHQIRNSRAAQDWPSKEWRHLEQIAAGWSTKGWS